MNLILVRHGKAEDHFVRGSDGERRLVKKGWKQARAVGRFLHKNDLLPDVILTSPLARAKETAEGISESLADKGVDVVPTLAAWLQCGMSPEIALNELSAYAELERVVIVGHEPDFSMLVEYFLGVEQGTVNVKKASIISITSCKPPYRGVVLQALIDSKWLPEDED
eukprot:Seg19922.1 transcript_id=Seg19922.1/GoldUCD/mRNA.D3Y31 product="putative protein sll0400" protein_id=Seg19922.1/GoldUCD/D3Y31